MTTYRNLLSSDNKRNSTFSFVITFHLRPLHTIYLKSFSDIEVLESNIILHFNVSSNSFEKLGSFLNQWMKNK